MYAGCTKKIPSPLFNVSIATWFKCIVRYSARITYMQNWNIGPLAFLLLLIRYFDANESELIIFTYLHLPASIFVISSQESSIIFWNVSFNKSTTATVSSEQAAAFEALIWVHSHLDFQQSWSKPQKGEKMCRYFTRSPLTAVPLGFPYKLCTFFKMGFWKKKKRDEKGKTLFILTFLMSSDPSSTEAIYPRYDGNITCEINI